MTDKCREALAELVRLRDKFPMGGTASEVFAWSAARAALAQPASWSGDPSTQDYASTQPHSEYPCRSDGRCQYAIDHGAEDLGHCPKGKCVMPDASPPAPQPAMLSDEQITRIWFESASGKITPTYFEFARAIERAIRSKA